VGAALASCASSVELFRSSIQERLLHDLLCTPDAEALHELPLLADRLSATLARVLRVEGARVLFFIPRPEGLDQDKATERLLAPASVLVEADGQAAVGAKVVEVARGSITSVAVEGGSAVVVLDARSDPRFNRACDKGRDFFGECRKPVLGTCQLLLMPLDFVHLAHSCWLWPCPTRPTQAWRPFRGGSCCRTGGCRAGDAWGCCRCGRRICPAPAAARGCLIAL
jgi:hypothetical protein